MAVSRRRWRHVRHPCCSGPRAANGRRHRTRSKPRTTHTVVPSPAVVQALGHRPHQIPQVGKHAGMRVSPARTPPEQRRARHRRLYRTHPSCLPRQRNRHRQQRHLYRLDRRHRHASHARHPRIPATGTWHRRRTGVGPLRCFDIDDRVVGDGLPIAPGDGPFAPLLPSVHGLPKACIRAASPAIPASPVFPASSAAPPVTSSDASPSHMSSHVTILPSDANAFMAASTGSSLAGYPS